MASVRPKRQRTEIISYALDTRSDLEDSDNESSKASSRRREKSVGHESDFHPDDDAIEEEDDEEFEDENEDLSKEGREYAVEGDSARPVQSFPARSEYPAPFSSNRAPQSTIEVERVERKIQKRLSKREGRQQLPNDMLRFQREAMTLNRQEGAKETNRYINFKELPRPQTHNEHLRYAGTIIAQIAHCDEGHLPPILSTIHMPYKAPKYEAELRDGAGKPVKSDWDNRSLTDIPWLPLNIPFRIEAWKLAVYMSLGATFSDITLRVSKSDSGFGAAKKEFTHVKNSLRKRTDDWRQKHGGLVFLGQSERNGKIPKITEVILRRSNLTPLNIFFNTTWEIDAKLGENYQPNGFQSEPGKRDAHKLYQPHAMLPEFRAILTKLDINIPTAENLSHEYPHLFPSYPYDDLQATFARPSKRPHDTAEATQASTQ